MMKKLLVLCAFLIACGPTLAQTPAAVAGEKGRTAAGLAVGGTFPFGANYDPGWIVEGSFDYYLGRLFAIRGTASYASSSTSFTDDFTRASFLGSAVFEFGGGSLRPYARGGIGLYVVSPPVGETRGRVGAHLGGGVEWFFNPRTALTGDAVFHLLPDTEDRSTSSFDVTIGVRHYF